MGMTLQKACNGQERRQNMKIIKAKDYQDMSKKAAIVIASQVTMKPDCVLGLATGSTPIGTDYEAKNIIIATGSTPIGTYKQLVEWYQEGTLSFAGVTSVNLDEYKGITKDNDQSYYYFMNDNLFQHVDINKERTFLPDGTEPDSEKACAAYNEIIHSVGGIDLQLLGLGHNGHIGFNEPADHFSLETNCVDLQESTINANKRFFASYDDVPKQAYTMGIKTIMQAKKVLVVVSGADKAEIVKKAFFGPVTPQVPASILQLHSDVVIVADEAALSLVEL